MPRQTPGTDNRVLRVCRLLNRARVRYLIAGSVAANLRGSVRATIVTRPITIVGDDPRVDILTVAWTVKFDDAWPNRVVRRIDGVRVPYLSLKDLTATAP